MPHFGLAITSTSTPKGNADEKNKNFGVTISDQISENCNNITLHQCYIYTELDASYRNARQWGSILTGIKIYGTYNRIINCHVLNGGGIQIGFHAYYTHVSGCVVENFPTDGAGIKCNYVIFENNYIYGQRKINGNHNDLCQAWASTGVIFRNNFLIAYVDPNQNFLAKPGISDVHGLASYDGLKTDWLITNNVVMVDHPKGICMFAYKNISIINNTVCRRGKLTFYPDVPGITLFPSKSGAKSSGCILINNLVEGLYKDSGVSVDKNNVLIKSLDDTFVNKDSIDMHLKKQIIGLSSHPSAIIPSTDIEGYPRNTESTYDVGAFEYHKINPVKFIERQINDIVVCDAGLQLSWSILPTDTFSYEIKKNGTRIAIIRTGITTFMYLTTSVLSTDKYTVASIPMISY